MDQANTKLFDRSSYSSTTISTYQIVGAYFVDVYYNHLYTEAIKFKTDGKVVSVTEGYRHATFAFLSALDNKAKGYRAEHYNKLLQGINEYFIFWTTYSGLTLSDCIDKIVKEFVPADYFQSLTKEQKRNILRTILIDSIRDFTKIVIGEFLGAIIDNHDETANVEALKEKIVDIFIMRRETMFHKFLDCRSGGKPTGETVDKKFLEKLRSDYMKSCALNEELLNQNKELTSNLEVVKQNAAELVQRFKKLKMKHDSLAQELDICKQKMAKQEETIKSAKYATPYKLPEEASYISYDTGDLDIMENNEPFDYPDDVSTHTGPSSRVPEKHVTEKHTQEKPVHKTTKPPIKRQPAKATRETREHQPTPTPTPSPPTQTEIKIPDVKNSFKKDETPSNELDEAAERVVDLGVASSISDVY